MARISCFAKREFSGGRSSDSIHGTDAYIMHTYAHTHAHARTHSRTKFSIPCNQIIILNFSMQKTSALFRGKKKRYSNNTPEIEIMSRSVKRDGYRVYSHGGFWTLTMRFVLDGVSRDGSLVHACTCIIRYMVGTRIRGIP